MTISQVENIELKLEMIKVSGETSNLEYHKDSVLGPLLFNICICDMIHVANYVDDTKPYIYDKNIEPVINSLEQSVNLLFNRFKDNDGKCHVFFNIDELIFTVFWKYCCCDKFCVINKHY